MVFEKELTDGIVGGRRVRAGLKGGCKGLLCFAAIASGQEVCSEREQNFGVSGMHLDIGAQQIRGSAGLMLCAELRRSPERRSSVGGRLS